MIVFAVVWIIIISPIVLIDMAVRRRPKPH